jgi:S-adenosylmethionine-diacylglycerol 3-amino-3-carboxypropyl transferase
MSEIKALDIKEDDTVVCITGSGGRTLNLLTSGPKEIISVDFNPIQNWMLELKINAVKNLDYDTYCGFLGLRPCKNRDQIFDRISAGLSDETSKFWCENIRLIKKGILYQGEFERHYRICSVFIKLFRYRKVKKLFSFCDLNEQIKFYHKEWDNKFWNFMVSLDSSGSNFERSMKDPAFYMYTHKDFDYQKFFHDSFQKAIMTGLACDNHFLGLTIDGSYKRVRTLPLYLQRDKFDILKANIDRIKIVTDSLESFLKKMADCSIDKYSISDVSGYLDDGQYQAIFHEIIRTAKDQAVFCCRNFIVQKEVPEVFKPYIIRNTELEKELEHTDLAFVYTFVTGQILREKTLQSVKGTLKNV